MGEKLFRRLIIIICLLVAPAAWADDPVVTVTPPNSRIYKKILLFPLEIPKYALQAATFPLGITSRYVERKHIQQRVADFLSNDDKTFWVYPIIEGGAGSGFGGGPALKHINLFDDGYQLSANYRIHINMDQQAGASIGKPDAFEIFGAPVSWSFSPQWFRFLDQNFYGFGNDSQQGNKSQYLINQTDILGEIAAHPLENFSVGLDLGYSLATTGEGDSPTIDSIFPVNSLSGFEKWLQYGIFGLKIEHDDRNNKSLPESGGLRKLTLARYQHFGQGSFNYNQLNLDLKQFIRLGGPRRVLGLHTGWTFQQIPSGNEIPYYRLATLDVYSPLRGFKRQRFVDRGMCVFNLEYRMPLWSTVDGVIFGDTGRVFHGVGDFSFKGFKYSAGGGLRMRAMNLMLFRLDVAYGGEGVNFIFGMSRSL